MRLSRGRVWRPLVALVVVAALVLVAPMPGAAQDGGPALALDRLSECVADSGQLSAVLLIDESGSLRDTDPDAARVDATQATLTALYGLSQTDVAAAAPTVEVKLAGFGAEYRSVGSWTELTEDSLAEAQERAEGFASRDGARDTDYVRALRGAQQDLNQRAATVAESGGQSTCQAILWFTDGGFDLEQRDADEAEDAREKSYAEGADLATEQGVSQAIADGRAALCEPGGVADELRANDVYVVAVAFQLATGGPNDPEGFLSSIVLGEGTNGMTCGDPAGAAETGAYVPAEDVSGIISRFIDVVCSLDGCASLPASGALDPGEDRPIMVDRAIGGITAVVTGAPDASVELSDPTGESATFRSNESGDVTVGSAQGTVTALRNGFFANLDLDPGAQSQIGTWRLGNTGDSAVSPNVQLGFGLEPVLGEEPQLEVGRERTLPVRIVDAAGEVVPLADVNGELDLSAEVVNPVSDEREQVDATPLEAEGTSSISYTVPEGTTASSLQLVVRLGGTVAGGVDVTPKVRSFDVPVILDPSLPQVLTSDLVLPPLSQGGDDRPDRGTAEDVIEVRGSSLGAGRVCVEGLDVTSVPRGTGDISTDGSCVDVPQGADVDIPVRIEPDEVKSGTAQGSVELELSSERTGAQASSAVPFEVTMFRGLDAGTLWALVVVLVAASLLLPLGALWLWTRLTSSFEAAEIGQLQAAVLPVSVAGSRLRRQDGGELVFSGDEPNLYKPPRHRAAEIGEATYEVAPRARLFGLPDALVRSGDVPIVGSGGAQRRLWGPTAGVVDHGLLGGWALALTGVRGVLGDQEPEVAGDLIIFTDRTAGWEQRRDDVLSDAVRAPSHPAVRRLSDDMITQSAASAGDEEQAGGDGPQPGEPEAGGGTPPDEASVADETGGTEDPGADDSIHKQADDL